MKSFGNTTTAFIIHETFNWSLLDLASVFDNVIVTLPSHSGRYQIEVDIYSDCMSYVRICEQIGGIHFTFTQ